MDPSFVFGTPLVAVGLAWIAGIIWVVIFAGVASDK